MIQSSVLAAAAKQMHQDAPFIRLFEVSLPTTPASKLRLANYDRDVEFDNKSDGAPIVWKRFDVAAGEFRENRAGDLDQLTINVSNVTRELMAYIHAYRGLKAQTLRILTVHSASLSELSAKLLFEGSIVTCEVVDTVAVFSVGSPELVQETFPARRWTDECGVERFGDADCGYVIPSGATNAVGGGFDFCPRTLAACRLRGDDCVARGLLRKHPKRFDGVPGALPGNP